MPTAAQEDPKELARCSRMLSNFFRITFPFEEFQISRLKYEPGLLAELREKHNATASFFRNGDYVYVSPMIGDPPKLGEVVTLKVAENIDVASSLVKHIFFRTFRHHFQRYLPQDFYPFTILSQRRDHDLAFNCLPAELRGIICFRELIEISIRRIIVGQSPVLGFVINVKYRWQFKRNLKELSQEGYGVIDKPVVEAHELPGLKGIVAPEERLIGLLRKMKDNRATIETNSGLETFNVETLFLHRSKKEIGEYLEFKLGRGKTHEFFRRIREQDKDRFDVGNVYHEITGIIGKIGRLSYRNLDSFCFKISKHSTVDVDSFTLEPTKYIFDYTPGCSSETPLRGLNQYGPFDSDTFDNKSPNILVICHKSNRGTVSSFLGKLENGIPSSRFFKKGLKGLFRLHAVTFKIHETESTSASDYETTIKEAIKPNPNREFDLAIVEGRESFKLLDTAENPYVRTKAALMNLGIPVQFVKDQTMRDNDDQLGLKLGPLALQTYAKLGGTAWVLPSSRNVDREIVVGVGNTLIRPNLFAAAEQSRIVGLTTFFSGDGRYLLGRQLKDVEYEQYFDELLRSLKSSISDLSEEYGWNEDDVIRIVFHIYKPIKNIEAQVVERLVESYSNYNIKFAFVTISDRHPFLMFDSSGRWRGQDRVNVPLRAENLILDDLTCLIQLSGRGERRTRYHRFSGPALIKIHENSTFHDLCYIAQQVLNLTCMSWRTFLPTYKPVTLFYADLIAQWSSRLRRIPAWNPDIINAQFRNKKWFL